MPDMEKGVAECYVMQRKSKNGNEYKVLCVEFSNGYTFETFLNNEQAFIVGSIIPIFE